MKINENCLPCLISQVIKVANITNVKIVICFIEEYFSIWEN
ncbi:hypothetical protein [Thomasclavelia ramosa]|nr:hypothetical protein [Thomasclavelia ramosa]MCQ5307488.1 hypothetical protein [Thomasclavelia ramosa]MCQ5326706.1 hypothetical protein [Thomasclavelia ramosa]